jgi:hypothetical protein
VHDELDELSDTEPVLPPLEVELGKTKQLEVLSGNSYSDDGEIGLLVVYSQPSSRFLSP